MLKLLMPVAVLFSVVTGPVTFAYEGWPGKPIIAPVIDRTLQHRVASPEHGWNVVVALKEDDKVVSMLRYNPDHEDLGRQYTSETDCKAAIDGDEALRTDIAQVLDKVTEYAKEHPDQKIALQIGCMQVDTEPQSF